MKKTFGEKCKCSVERDGLDRESEFVAFVSPVSNSASKDTSLCSAEETRGCDDPLRLCFSLAKENAGTPHSRTRVCIVREGRAMGFVNLRV